MYFWQVVLDFRNFGHTRSKNKIIQLVFMSSFEIGTLLTLSAPLPTLDCLNIDQMHQRVLEVDGMENRTVQAELFIWTRISLYNRQRIVQCPNIIKVPIMFFKKILYLRSALLFQDGNHSDKRHVSRIES